VNIANPEIEHSEKGTGGGVIFSPEEDFLLEYTIKHSKERDEKGFYLSERVIKTKNIVTDEQLETLIKEKYIWGMRTLVPVAITNLAVQDVRR